MPAKVQLWRVNSFSDFCTHHGVYYRNATLNSYRNEATEHLAFILRTKRAQRKVFKKTELNLYFEEIIIAVE